MNRITDYENLSSKIEDWIKNYSISNNIDNLVVGVSGGIDSAVVSTLCARTGMKTTVVDLPIKSNPENTKFSELQISNLTSKYRNVMGFHIDLSSVFDEFQNHKAFKSIFTSGLGFANSKSRLRMLSLYQIANSLDGGAIVVGTGNKVEDFGIGFYTKYGDGGVDISPIADLYKTEVRELGKYLEVPQDIIKAEPTDGLWDDNRTDENQIGASYEELEWVMEIGLKKNSLRLTQKEKDLIKTYSNFNKKNKHKMVPIPIFDLSENRII